MTIAPPPPNVIGPHTDAHKILNAHAGFTMVATDYTSLQAAIDAAGSGGRVVIPAGTYTTQGLNLTNRRGVIMEGIGLESTIIELDGYPIDMTGAEHCILRNLTIRGKTTNPPQMGVLLARSSTLPGAFVLLDNLTFTGHYQLGCILGVSNECGTFRNLNLWPDPDGAQFGIYTAGVNTWNIESLYTPVNVIAGNVCNWYSNLSIVCIGAEKFIPFWFGDSHGVVIRDSYIATNGPAQIRLDLNHYQFQAEGIIAEGTANDVVYMTVGISRVVILRNIAATHATTFLNQQPGAVIDGLITDGCWIPAGIVK